MVDDSLILKINSFNEEGITSSKCDDLLKDIINGVDGFVIFGAMHTGIEIKRMLEAYHANIFCFLDEINKSDNLDNLLIVHSFDELLERFKGKNICVIISSNVPKSMRIMTSKVKKKMSGAHILDKEPLYFAYHKGSVRNNGVAISMFGLLPNNVCTLRCNGCCYMIPHVKAEYKKNFDIIDLKKEITNLSKIVDYIVNFEILGGEPTLHPDLAELITHIRACGNIFQIVLVTNGTIVPSKEVIDAIEKNHVIVRISDYGDCSKNKYKLVDALKGRDIIWFMRSAGEFPWTDYGEFRDDGGDGTIQWDKCRDRGNCIQYRGKIWPCGRAFRQIENGLYGEEKATYVNLYDNVEKARVDLKNMLERNNATYGCRYCGDMDKTIEAGIQLIT